MAENEFESEPQAAHDAAAGEVATLQAEVAELKDRLLRALAEAENTRRRAERDRHDATQYAVTRFARDMLTVSDNLRRALDAFPAEARADAAPQIKAVLEGVEATERQLVGTLESHGVRVIDTAEARFDPHLHQAIAEVPADGKPAGTIVNVVQTGYVIADRLLRPAMVTVARGDQGSGSVPGNAVDTQA
ncbi:MAG TPA: nucleotide exchange factor GrpE [Rhizomicrobium sp.]|jgi:molecular chaperone GrpE